MIRHELELHICVAELNWPVSPKVPQERYLRKQMTAPTRIICPLHVYGTGFTVLILQCVFVFTRFCLHTPNISCPSDPTDWEPLWMSIQRSIICQSLQ